MTRQPESWPHTWTTHHSNVSKLCRKDHGMAFAGWELSERCNYHRSDNNPNELDAYHLNRGILGPHCGELSRAVIYVFTLSLASLLLSTLAIQNGRRPWYWSRLVHVHRLLPLRSRWTIFFCSNASVGTRTESDFVHTQAYRRSCVRERDGVLHKSDGWPVEPVYFY